MCVFMYALHSVSYTTRKGVYAYTAYGMDDVYALTNGI